MGHLAAWAADLLDELPPTGDRTVVDVAAGSGHLLAPFRTAGVHVGALESDPELASACRAAGIPTSVGSIGRIGAGALRELVGPADVVLANHALAHVDDLDDAVAGIALLLKPGGRAAIEFHHVLALVTEGQWDAVAHAHRTYLSVTALLPVLSRHGLIAVEAIRTAAHGGSVRVLARRAADASAVQAPDGAGSVAEVLLAEHGAGLDGPDGFRDLAAAVTATCDRLRSFLETARADGLAVAGYGAPGRAATLCNTAGITAALLPYTVDRSPEKQGRLLPGCRIPIRAPEAIDAERPDLILILPWTLREEIVGQLAAARRWGGRFVVALPTLLVDA